MRSGGVINGGSSSLYANQPVSSASSQPSSFVRGYNPDSAPSTAYSTTTSSIVQQQQQHYLQQHIQQHSRRSEVSPPRTGRIEDLPSPTSPFNSLVQDDQPTYENMTNIPGTSSR